MFEEEVFITYDFFAPPVTLEVTGEPLRSTTRAAISEQVRQLLTDAEAIAQQRVVT